MTHPKRRTTGSAPEAGGLEWPDKVEKIADEAFLPPHPEGGFDLRPGETVVDCGKFVKGLMADYAAGPAGPRGASGSLQRDLVDYILAKRAAARASTPEMFALPEKVYEAHLNNPDKDNLREKAAQWIREHPKVADLFLKYAREMAGRGRKFGIGLIAERIRWEVALEGWEGEEYKINNNFRAYVARWLIERDPSLEAHMTFREVSW